MCFVPGCMGSVRQGGLICCIDIWDPRASEMLESCSCLGRMMNQTVERRFVPTFIVYKGTCMASMIVISCRRCDRRFQEVLDDPLQSQVNLNVANSFFRQHAVLSEMTASDSNHEYNPVHSRLSPTAQVASHILQKGYQAGSIVGSFAVLPASVALAWLYYKKPVSPSDLVRRVGISCAAGVGAIGMLVEIVSIRTVERCGA